ncbi:imidazole glycerol phosphate synthase subunit HisH [Candidatus Nitrosocosmicus franklandus]|uniref:Imidazole glycerol phosphate synthase subunit HisH n=1 Tax=Candidatus Nitrosocosmicus franklandianus TaxID=1798806 RepID=A0A484IA33_9ARCH|nr:imidazole glycerol phosphate synthase subunit HisH [Candidatus Nitrosocosmicus franklandus]VFJ14103.1 Imidazole glycerol phosphate synthase subunit HisH [Candidatus Nitrosocosmicus franklandus]
MIKVSIFDYGAGNIFSLKSSLQRNGADEVKITNYLDFDSISDEIDGIILPGVGNFDPAIISINKCRAGFSKIIEKNIPVLGICLGMEMLFEKSEEGKLAGLDIIKGEVLSLPKNLVKIPHIGWNCLEITEKDSKLFEGVSNGSWVYFVHSYYTTPKDSDIITSTSNYGINIPASIEVNNIYCTQFHPEKSSTTGERMIKNFVKICKRSK